jgi:hypothetical protein
MSKSPSRSNTLKAVEDLPQGVSKVSSICRKEEEEFSTAAKEENGQMSLDNWLTSKKADELPDPPQKAVQPTTVHVLPAITSPKILANDESKDDAYDFDEDSYEKDPSIVILAPKRPRRKKTPTNDTQTIENAPLANENEENETGPWAMTFDFTNRNGVGEKKKAVSIKARPLPTRMSPTRTSKGFQHESQKVSQTTYALEEPLTKTDMAGSFASDENVSQRKLSRRKAAEPRVANALTKSKLTNHKQIKIAISSVCLAGLHFLHDRTATLKAIDRLAQEEPRTIYRFLILLQSTQSMVYRGLYGLDSCTREIIKLVGKGPKIVNADSIKAFIKFETSTRTFKALPTKSISDTVDAIVIEQAKSRK